MCQSTGRALLGGGVDCGCVVEEAGRYKYTMSQGRAGQLQQSRKASQPFHWQLPTTALSRPDDAKAAHPALSCPDLPRPLPSLPGERGGPRRRPPRTRNPHAANASQIPHQHGERRGPWTVSRGSGGWISARACSLVAASTCRRRKAVRDASGTHRDHRDEWPRG